MAKPNILFLFTDDQRFDTIGALGHPVVKTPNMDRLVARGTAFTHACILGGSSGAVCMPSRAMLHTGRTLWHIERQGQSIPESHTTLGEHFQRAGYATYGIGKWHNGPESFARSFTGGAEIFFGGMADHWNVPACNYDPSGRYAQRLRYCTRPYGSNETRAHVADHIHNGRHSSETLTDAAVALLDAHTSNQPFFMYISYLAPHDPRTMPEEFRTMYDPARIELPPNYRREHPFDLGIHGIRDEVLAAQPRDDDEVRRHIAEYYAMISHLDAQIGRVLNRLEQLGLADETIVVFAGDNGLAVGQHSLMGKQNLYDHSVRVPLVFAGPGVPDGERRDGLCTLIDVFPTLCDLTGCDVPATVEGISLTPTLEASYAAVRDSVLLAYCESMRGVRDCDHKLIECNVGGERHTQLFNLRADPWERDDLAADPGQAPTLARLRDRLDEWRTRWDDNQEGMGQTFWGG